MVGSALVRLFKRPRIRRNYYREIEIELNLLNQKNVDKFF